MGTHGYRNTAEYRAWSSMKSRCSNPRHRNFEDYGGRGIYVCEDWKASFSSFLADMGEKPSSDMQLERVDNDGPYSPENCVWGTRKTQARNRRSSVTFEIDGKSMTISEMSEMSGIGYQTIRKRIDRGWSPKDSMTLSIVPYTESGIRGASRRYQSRVLP